MQNIDKRTNSTLSQIDQMKARKEQTKKEIQQLENRQKVLLNKISMDERKARTRRLIERGAILESVIASSETLTNEAIHRCVEQTVWGKGTIPKIQKNLHVK